MTADTKSDLDECLHKHDLHRKEDNIVCWNDSSKQRPGNWNLQVKCYTATVVIWLEFYMTLLSSSGAAAAKAAYKEYGVSEELAVFAFITVYLLGQTVGGIVCSPISEFFGRRTIYILSAALYGVSSVIVALPNNMAGVFVGRAFQGVAAAIPATVAFGNFTDMFDADVRVWVVYTYTLFGMAGLALGPIYSTYVTLLLSWKWVFYISAVASAVSVVASCFMKESNADQLLENETKMIRKESGDSSLISDVEGLHQDHAIQSFVQDHLYRPLTFLFTEPLIGLCAVLCATAFGLIYGLTEALTITFTTPPLNNTFSENSASLAFLAILIGELLNVFPRIYDARLLKSQRKLKKRITPETKIRSFAIACPTLAVGLWIFAWTIPSRVTTVPWPIPMIGLICVGFAANDFSYVLFGYITDAYGSHAASAVSSLSTARTLTAAIFPLFMTQMYDGLGNNIATTVLAAVATLFCFTPFLFLTYGKDLRKRSPWAANDEDCLKEENWHLEGEDSQQSKGSEEKRGESV